MEDKQEEKAATTCSTNWSSFAGGQIRRVINMCVGSPLGRRGRWPTNKN